ncbi:MAG: DUF882 domain-containing protein [Elusimicrobiales bacterium]|nr:DUF882 domain-containing protein [Elusimicrobiales bacterium]
MFVCLIYFLTNINFWGQNLFIASLNISTASQKIFIDNLIDIDFDFKNNISGFSFEDLLISTNIISEYDIREIEEDDETDFLKEIYSLVEPQPINLGGDGILTILRKDTGEKITVKYRNKDDSYNEDALKQINYLARCSLTGEERKIPVKLIEIIDKISDRFGKRTVILLSGYRTKPLNDITPGAAKRSLHLIGWAMDIKVDGVSAKRIKDYAKTLKMGGVGYYPAYGFVHIDIGKVRYWQKYQYRKKPKYAKNVSSKKNRFAKKNIKNSVNIVYKKK